MTTSLQPRSKPGAAAALVVVAVLVGIAALAFVGLRGQPTVSRAQQAHQIAAGLRCPVCQDLSAADSPAPLAGQMRQQISQQLAAGRSPDQIRSRFVASYGDSVLMTPPHRGAGRIAAVLPLGVLLVALGTAAVLLRRWRGAPAGAAPTTSEDVRPPLSDGQRRQLERARGALRQLRDLDDDLAAGGPAQRARSGARQRWLRIGAAVATVVAVAVGTGLALHDSINPRGAGQAISGADPNGSEAASPARSRNAGSGRASAAPLTAAQVDAVNTAVAKVNANPKSVPSHLELARAYSAANQLQLSTVEYLAAAQLDPSNAEASTGLALAAFVAGQPQEAKQIADKVLSATPAYPEALYARGLIQLMGLKEAAAAQTDLKAYLQAAPYGAHRSAVETLLAMIPADKAGK